MTNLESGQRTSPFLSYCWDDLDMAYMLEALLAAKGVELIWDKRCLKLDDSISQLQILIASIGIWLNCIAESPIYQGIYGATLKQVDKKGNR